jgi:uncharacterized protein (TIGR02996 family)
MVPLQPWRPILFDDPDRDPQETAFLKSIVETPDDDGTRLIYADWLEEHGQAEKAQFVRLEVELSKMPRSDSRFTSLDAEMGLLEMAVSAEWTWALARPARVLNCGSEHSHDPRVRFDYHCPNRWADLQPTKDLSVRYCEECHKKVYYCESKAEAERHACRGHCIAINSCLALAVEAEHAPAPPDDGELLGLPMSPTEIWAEELFSRRKRWWQFWR